MPSHHLLPRWLLAVAVLSALLPQETATASDKIKAEGDPLAAYAQSDAFTHNLTWHRQVGENEIRTSWFLRGEPGIAMVCTADLSASKVTTSREVYNHASQSTKTRELSHAQVLTLRKLIEELPPSAKAPEFKHLVLVSVVENGTAKTSLYDRLSLPRNIVRVYDLTGAYVVTEDPDDTDAGERVKAGDALPATEDGVREKRAVVSEEEAVRVLLRAYRAETFGTQAPAGWPEKIVRDPDKWTWVVDIDTSKLPGGFPEQFVVSVSGTGGHTDKPKIGDK